MTSGRIFSTKYDNATQRAKYLCELLSKKWVDPVDATWTDAATMDYITNQIDKAISELID